jgi:beta-glucosidase
MLQLIMAIIILFPITIVSREIHWDWSSIDHTNISFPNSFLWGCADSALQTEGVVTVDGKQVHNSWTEHEQLAGLKTSVGVACERWTRYKEDFQLLKSIGMKAYRFSIDWSKIEPEQGKFDYAAMQHYIDVVDELRRLDITPMITLFHHVSPLWFLKQGGFEKAENIRYFTRYALFVYNHLHMKVPMWIIFNEPVAYAFEGYFRANYPPRKNSLVLAGTVILNQLNAHVEAVQEFRKINPNPQIGIAHMSHPIDAYTKWNFFEQAVTKLFSYLMNETTIEFFKTGKFKWIVPWKNSKNPLAPGTLDFFGVNYYTHTTIKQINPFKMEACIRPDEKVIDMSQTPERSKVMYPEGLYRSIVRASRLQIPIYITENGVATSDSAMKEEYIKKHLYVVSRALSEGYDVRGYFFWTLTDCFSWNKGYDNKHGVFQVDFTTQQRTFRPSLQYLVDVVRQFS